MVYSSPQALFVSASALEANGLQAFLAMAVKKLFHVFLGRPSHIVDDKEFIREFYPSLVNHCSLVDAAAFDPESWAIVARSMAGDVSQLILVEADTNSAKQAHRAGVKVLFVGKEVPDISKEDLNVSFYRVRDLSTVQLR